MNKKFSANFGIIIPSIIVLFNIFLVLHPTEMITAGRDGLLMWFNQVLPALLPFVVGVNLLAGLGFIHFLGALMAPIMVPLFKVPGSGAFALLTGLTSGYPMGAKAVAHLRETGQVSKQEAQRLIAFCNNAGPLFVVGFVGAGLFGSVRLGYILLISHISAAIIIGLVVRFLFAHPISQDGVSFFDAFKKFHEFRQHHYSSFGQVLGSSIKNAMESMVLIGGFIIVFCVVIKALEISGLLTLVDYWGQGAIIVAGLLEVANGAKMVAQGGPPNPSALAATAAIISFGGLSVHGQVAHFIQDTDIKFAPYLVAKSMQAILAGAICLMIEPML